VNLRFESRTRHRKALLTVVIGAISILLAGCNSGSASSTGSSTGQVDRNATLRVGVDGVPTNFDPIQNPGNQGNYTLPELYDQLVQLDDKFQPTAMLATSWDYNADGTQLTMQLRTDAVFNGDGTPVNAAAVKSSLERAKTNPKSLVAASLATLKDVTAVNDTTVKFTFSEPSYSFVSDLAMDPRISSVVDPAHSGDSLATTPAGSGPYTLGSATQTKIVFNRVAKHWDSTSGLAKTIELSGIPDQNSRFNAIKAGQLDVTYINTGQYDSAKQLTSTGQFHSYYEPKAQKFGIRVNGTAKSKLSNPLVRQAISKAVDRTQFCNTIFPDMSTPSRQLVSPTDSAYDQTLDDAKDLTAQPDQAKSLLAQAGVGNLKVNYLAFTTLAAVAEVVQQQLGDAGATVKVDTQASYPAVLSAWLAGSYDASGFAFAVGDASSIVRQNLAADPVSGGVPDYAKASLKAANSAAPGAARDTAMKKLNTVLTDEPVNIPLCNVGLGLIGSSKVTGLDQVRFLAFAPPFESRKMGKTS
jgi:peptide/nickel transport system substrate-binding protein